MIPRRPAKPDVALTRSSAEGQMELLLPDQDVELWEYAVPVTNSRLRAGVDGAAVPRPGRCRQRLRRTQESVGWGGFTTQDMERCQSSARAVALVYNGWSWYGRAAKPEARMEAITSRAHAAGCRRPSHQTCRTDNALSDDNARAARTALMPFIANIRAALSHVRKVAEQFALN